ncbi:hypothetical protein [Streptomyces rhizosphaericus]|uniref:Uncharacterized protein n=1 Tax=Streptomyces rhizosphaericus TaxID=114699 RepID=A0A6G4AYP4_9ACTN|nr:hypothetical protein [Streptomyces rhizosphaericus]NEW77661.1 hypothetical protein [Streptomyces rhizosphaericus]
MSDFMPRPARDLTPPVPVSEPLTGPVELAAERGPVVYVPGAHGGFVAVHREDLPTVPAPAPPPPVPAGIDPHAQRLGARGVFAAGAGVGTYFAAQGLAVVLNHLVQGLIAAGVAVGVVLATGGRRGGDTYITNHHVTNRWFGRSTTNIRNH